jgi:hypothetical protein
VVGGSHKGGVLRQGAVAREAAGGTSEWKRHGGAGTKKIRWRCPFKGRDGEAAKGGPAVRTPHGVERAWGLAPIVSRPAAARLGSAALFRAGARRGRLTRGPRLAAGEGGRREARAEHGPA